MWLAEPFVIPERRDSVTGYNNISPRVGAVYDVFGTGKTSLRVNWSKYLRAANAANTYLQLNPASTCQFNTTINWTDTNNNRVVDCDLRNPHTPSTGDVCGGWHNRDFGRSGTISSTSPCSRKCFHACRGGSSDAAAQDGRREPRGGNGCEHRGARAHSPQRLPRCGRGGA